MAGTCICSPGFTGLNCETMMLSELFMDGELPLNGEGEAGWVDGPAYNNAGGLFPLSEGEDFTPSGATNSSNNTNINLGG